MSPRRAPSRSSTTSPAKDTPSDRSLIRRLVTAPKLVSAKKARALVDRWLSELGKNATAQSLKLLRKDAKFDAILCALAENSPYLLDLARADPARLAALAGAEPEQRFASILSGLSTATSAAQDEAAVMRLLRMAKAEAALLIALADIGGVWPVMEVTRALTEFADAAVQAALGFLLRQSVELGLLRAPRSGGRERGSGYIVLAMGKMGAFELNYSSDIDLIVVFDPDAPAMKDGVEPGGLYVRLTRSLVKLLQERTEHGYVFRVDLRLRPDPASTQIAISLLSALSYYESLGQNWERAAMIKARVCAGDGAAGEALLKELSPFVWRKYLDFAAVADVHAMKGQIHAYRGHGEIAVEGHNIKLGRGGIREIEFFVQTQQLIAGGRHPELRGRATLDNLRILAENDFISAQARDDLTAAYTFLRTVEHRLQMVADEQTHTLPAEPAVLERFAHFMGFPERDAFAAALTAHLLKVQEHYAGLFERNVESAAADALTFSPEADDRETLDKLMTLGFRQPLAVSHAVREWLQGQRPALKGEFARAELRDLVPLLMAQLARAEKPDSAFTAFDRFLGGLHGGGRLFSLLRQNPGLLALMSLTLGIAPRLADILARYPHVMDTLVDPAFFGTLPDKEKLAAGLDRSLEQARSYEDFLDRIRMFGQEHMFLIGARILSGTVSAEQSGGALARLAGVLIRKLFSAVEENFVTAHGTLRKQDIAVLAMGKLGGREMTASSDLDLILIYDFDAAHPESSGPRSLYGGQYFARLTQRFVSALTAPTNYGALYPVDMRLRPSGRSGPLATHIDSFQGYQDKEAWTWEQMALTRARVVAASPAFASRVEGVIHAALRRPRDAAVMSGDVVEMRRAIAAEHSDKDCWNLKYASGGLIDLEFIAQYLQLVHAAKQPHILSTSTAAVLNKAAQLGVLAPQDADVLRPAARLYHALTQILRLCLPGDFDPAVAGTELLMLLARGADLPDFATLDAHLRDTQIRVRQSFGRVVGALP